MCTVLSDCGEAKWEPTCAVTDRSWATSGNARQSESPAGTVDKGLTIHSKIAVGMAGFEPAASCSQSRRANQAALHPVPPSFLSPFYSCYPLLPNLSCPVAAHSMQHCRPQTIMPVLVAAPHPVRRRDPELSASRARPAGVGR